MKYAKTRIVAEMRKGRLMAESSGMNVKSHRSESGVQPKP